MSEYQQTDFPEHIQTAEIISVGTELLLGEVVNTDTAFLSEKLAKIGINVFRQTVVGDRASRVRASVIRAFTENEFPSADMVIMTGGLGPTCDDLTKETIADLFGKKLVLDEPSLKRIVDYFTKTGKVMTPNNKKQAMMPEDAVIFPNDYGTAPAFAFSGLYDGKARVIIALPGPPDELFPLFTERVLPWLTTKTRQVIVSHNLHIVGMGESTVESHLYDLMQSSANPSVSPYCQNSTVRVRITAKAESTDLAESMITDCIEKVRQSPVGPYIYAIDCPSAMVAFLKSCSAKNRTVSCVEVGCKGNLIKTLQSDTESVNSFAGGMSFASKNHLTSVWDQIEKKETPDDIETVCALSSYIRKATGSDIGVSLLIVSDDRMADTCLSKKGSVFLGLTDGNKTFHFEISLASTKKSDFIISSGINRAGIECVRCVSEGQIQ